MPVFCQSMSFIPVCEELNPKHLSRLRTPALLVRWSAAPPRRRWRASSMAPSQKHCRAEAVKSSVTRTVSIYAPSLRRERVRAADLGDVWRAVDHARDAMADRDTVRSAERTLTWIFRRWGRSLTVPSMTSFADFGSTLLPGLRAFRPGFSLLAEDQSALRDPSVPRDLPCRAGRPGVLPYVGAGHGFPWDSLVFFLFPRGVCRDCGGVGHRAQPDVVPSRLDQQSAGVGVPGLGGRALGAGRPRG